MPLTSTENLYSEENKSTTVENTHVPLSLQAS